MSENMRLFLKLLRDVPRDWYMSSRAIRMSRTGPTTRPHCPLTAVGGGVADDIMLAARRLGLSPEEADEVVNAADGVCPYSPELRNELLEACGLKEVE